MAGQIVGEDPLRAARSEQVEGEIDARTEPAVAVLRSQLGGGVEVSGGDSDELLVAPERLCARGRERREGAGSQFGEVFGGGTAIARPSRRPARGLGLGAGGRPLVAAARR